MSLIKNNPLALILSILIIMGSVLYMQAVNNCGDGDSLEIVDGQVYLGEGTLDSKKVYKLDGMWEFYPDRHIIGPGPDEGVTMDEAIKTYIPLPGSWRGYLSDSDSSNGIGSYRLTFQIDPSYLGQEIGIRVNKARSASKAYINGLEVGANGDPDPAHNEEFNRPYFASYFITEENLELTINVNDNFTRDGGITQSIIFGSKGAIQSYHFQTRFISLLAVVTAFLTSFTFMTAYFYRREQKSLLYFSAFCFFLGALLSVIGEVMLKDLFTSMPYSFFMVIAMNSSFFILAFFTLFFQEIITENIDLDGEEKRVMEIKRAKLMRIKRIIYPVLFLVLPLIIILMLSPVFASYRAQMFYIIVPTNFVIAITVLIYTIYIVRGSINHDINRRGYLLIISVSVGALFINYGYSMRFDLNRKNLLDIIVLIIIAVFVSLFMKQFQMLARKLDQRSNELVVERELRDNALLATIAEIQKILKRTTGQLDLHLETDQGIGLDRQEDYQESFYNIRSASDTINHLLEEVQLLAKTKEPIGFQEKAEEIEIADLDNLVKEIRGLICRGTNIKIEIIDKRDLDSSCLIFLHKKHFYQIMSNLIVNAVSAIKKRQEREDFPGNIKIIVSDQGDMLEFRIIDNGIGISSQDAAHIFQPFYQKSLESMGIGLSLSRKIARLYQGDITYQPSPTRGASFTLSLPYHRREQELVAIDQGEIQLTNVGLPDDNERGLSRSLKYKKESHKNAAYKGKMSILIICDQAKLTRQLDKILKDDYQVFLVNNMSKGQEVITSERIDLIITDNISLDKTGLDLAREMREDKKYRAIPIFILTGLGRKIIEKHHGIQANIMEYIELPLNKHKLLSDIQALEMVQYARDLAIEKELKFLHVQITPHFLFNSLNSIIGLSMTDQERSRYALENLAAYLHLKLDLVGSDLYIPIDKEIDLVHAYLNIEQIRFQDQLIIDMEIDEDINILIPPLTIQPLVENAIYHGIRKSRRAEATLTVRIRQTREGVHILIADDGAGMNQEDLDRLLAGQTEGVGFYNVKRKLELIDGARLEVESAVDQGTSINIYLTNN